MEISPKPIYGNWSAGWALDRHTLSSRAASGSEGGPRSRYDRFATERSEIGEALFRLKYQNDRAQVGPLAGAVSGFIRSHPGLADINAVLAVPPSNADRSFQPVALLAAAVGMELGLAAPDDYVRKTRTTPPLKNIDDKHERREELDGAFAVVDQRFAGQHLLLLDDLYRSGETLKAVTAALLFAGKAGRVSVVALTATRTRK
jgi:predicted amidophosphoribosyltransferase